MLLRCAGASPEICEERTIATYDDPAQGSHLVLISKAALESDQAAGLNRLHPASWAEMTPSEASWAMRRFVLGGQCFLSGAVIPPLPQSQIVSLWGGEMMVTYAAILPETQGLDVRARLGVAASQVSQRFPVFGAFEDPRFLDQVAEDAAKDQADLKAQRAAERAAAPKGRFFDEDEDN